MLPSFNIRAALLFCGLAFGLVCVLSAQQPEAEPQPDDGIWIDVPHFRQPDEGCGAASIAMVMEYWNRHRSIGEIPALGHESMNTDENQERNVDKIHSELYEPREHGIPADRLAPYLVRHGFQAFAIRSSWDDLRQHLEKGRPLIVAYATGASTFHYAVAAGIAHDTITVNDPAGRKLQKISREEFERRWQATRNWALLAVPAPTGRQTTERP